MSMFKNKPIIFWYIFFILLPLQEVSAQPHNEQPKLEEANHVITHRSLTDAQISLNELRSIFSLRARKWPDGTPITVFVLRDQNKVHRDFLLKTLKMLPHQLRRHWDRYIYSGIGQGPVVVDSQEEMLSNVQSTPGAIGYLEGGVPDGQVHKLSIL